MHEKQVVWLKIYYDDNVTLNSVWSEYLPMKYTGTKLS